MSEVDKLIEELRGEADAGVGLAFHEDDTIALFRRAAQTISDQQDYIDNLARGLSSLRADNARLVKLLEKDVHE